MVKSVKPTTLDFMAGLSLISWPAERRARNEEVRVCLGWPRDPVSYIDFSIAAALADKSEVIVAGLIAIDASGTTSWLSSVHAGATLELSTLIASVVMPECGPGSSEETSLRRIMCFGGALLTTLTSFCGVGREVLLNVGYLSI